jgi:large subunit ribosomal protein L28
MAKCEVCNKGVLNGNKISIARSHVSRRTQRFWKPNVKKVKIVEPNGRHRTIHICVKCLRGGAVKRVV